MNYFAHIIRVSETLKTIVEIILFLVHNEHLALHLHSMGQNNSLAGGQSNHMKAKPPYNLVHNVHNWGRIIQYSPDSPGWRAVYLYRSIIKVISLRNISKVFSHFLKK